MPIKKLVTLFWSLAIIYVFGLAIQSVWIPYFAKPLLMPALMWVLTIVPANFKGKQIIFTGLIFAWLGDIFLLFESYNSDYFIAGLACFLLTHLCYIIFFIGIKSAALSFLKKQPFLVILTVFFCSGLLIFLFPFLGDLKIPVLVYGTVICFMMLGSLHIYLKVNKPANNYFIIGAMFFLLSDSLLALNKFYTPIVLSSIWIILTYCAAQYFIVIAFIKTTEAKEKTVI